MSHGVLTHPTYLKSQNDELIRFHQIERNYIETGIARDDCGYDEDGFDLYGYDRDGYDRNGLDRDGRNRQGVHYLDEPRWNVFLASIDPNYTPRPPEDVLRRYLDMINANTSSR